MLIHLPPIHAGLAQFNRLARPIEGIEVVTTTDLASFLNPWNPETAANIRHIKESVALGIVEAKDRVRKEPLHGTFKVCLARENESVEKVEFLWSIETQSDAAATPDTACAPAA